MNTIFTRKDTTVDDYHGTPVADPYRWLEDAHSDETRAWSEKQSALAHDYLAHIPLREQLKERLMQLWDYPRYGVPRKEGERYFFSRNSGLQNQAVLYMSKTFNGEAIEVLDPNTLSSDGTVAMIDQSFSVDGRLMAYSLSSSGSDWHVVRIRDVDTGYDYPETLHWLKFSLLPWRHDHSGFYYSRYPDPRTVAPEEQSYYQKVYWHKLGTEQAQDQLIYEHPTEKSYIYTSHVSEDGVYLLLTIKQGSDPRCCVYYREEGTDQPFIRLLDEFDASYVFLGNSGPVFYFQTNLDAPRGRIIAIDTRHPERANWREVLPEQDDTIALVRRVHRQFLVITRHDARHRLQAFDEEGHFLHEIVLPAPGSLIGLSGKAADTACFFTFTSYLYPPSVYRYDCRLRTLERLHDAEILFDSTQYETRQVFYTSRDGTRVPMCLTHRKGLALDGSHPVLLSGYGGFNASLTPLFSIPPLAWLELGGIYAVANLRGGSEYGEEWHRAGMLEKKQNVFDDFIAAGEWLIEQGYTRPARLAIVGGSNGGLLVAACMVQRPELYGAVICRVPVIDMLRYHRFTVGRFWTSEYGNAEQNAEHFRFLYAYSPLHNVKEGVSYPPILLMTADSDDRVVPSHAKKFAATLQAVQQGDNPVLLRLDLRAGHGLGKPMTKLIEEESDLLAFLCKHLAVA